uniref:Uncharacterized protein n=3 Tax=Caenorhabditis japonica TaxID=281687 RepID=A0A8R1I8A2_CAEJA
MAATIKRVRSKAFEKLQPIKVEMISRCVLLIVLISFILSPAMAGIDFSTCARMDISGLDKVARGLCITSCSMQNCGTGYCEKRGGRPTCVCSRCANGGGNIPLDAIIKKGR